MDVDAAMAAADARMTAIEKRQAEKITNLQAKLAALRDVLEWAADYVRRWHIRYPDDGETQRLKEKCDKALAAGAGTCG